jgi:hypothetical protein
MIALPRRGFLSFLAAPAIVRASSIMAVAPAIFYGGPPDLIAPPGGWFRYSYMSTDAFHFVPIVMTPAAEVNRMAEQKPVIVIHDGFFDSGPGGQRVIKPRPGFWGAWLAPSEINVIIAA